ncbi:MAG: 50S ribosomal protein L30 [Flexilinea sp.]
MPEKSEPKKMQITYVKSAIGYSKKHKQTIKALGFHHLNETVVQEDNPSIRGMLQMVNHLVKIVELVD